MSTRRAAGHDRLADRLGSALSSDGRLVATPPDAATMADALAIASEAGMRVLVAGRGLRLDWGNPVETDLALGTSGLTRLVDYAPDDMIVTAEAGMTLAALNALLATRSQVLPLEVPHPDRTTLGGLVAAAPLPLARTGYGEVKDWLIGLSVATPDGALVRAGGKVVKNVAGYDLCKLYAGSLGTLGAIASVTFRVRPRWERTALVSAGFSPASAEAALEAVQTTLLAPSVSVLRASDHALRLSLGFDGFAETVDWQTREAMHLFEQLGGQDLEVLEDAVAIQARRELADALHGPTLPGVALRCSVLPSELLGFLETARSLPGTALTAIGLAQHGSLWLRRAVPDAGAWLAGVRAIASRHGGHATLEGRQGWPEETEAFELAGASRVLMRRLQAALDPRGTMAPGRFRLEGGARGAS